MYPDIKRIELKEILGKKISLPDLQRNFQMKTDFFWEGAWLDVLADAEKRLKTRSAKGHYFKEGCILCPNGEDVQVIIDMGQRLVMLSLFLQAIYDSTEADAFIDFPPIQIYQSLVGDRIKDSLKILDPDCKKRRGKTSPQDRAYSYFRSKIEEEKMKRNEPADFMQSLRVSLEDSYFNVLVLDTWKQAAEEFDRCNRKVDFKAGDRAKSYLWAYFDESSLNLCSDRWNKIEKLCPSVKKDPTLLLLTFLRLYTSPVEDQNLYAVLDSVLRDEKNEFGKKQAKNFFRELVSVAEWLGYIQNPGSYPKQKSSIRDLLVENNLYLKDQTSHFPLLVKVLRELSTLDPKPKETVYENFKNLVFRVFARVPFVSGNPVKGFGVMFSDATREITPDPKGDFLGKLEKFFSLKIHEGPESFNQMKGGQLASLKNFIPLYLDTFSKETHKDTEQKEHIMPRSDGKTERGRWTASVGNLVYLDKKLNNKASDKDFNAKKEIYREADGEPKRIAETYETWDIEQIKMRQVEILEAVNRKFPRFSFPEETA